MNEIIRRYRKESQVDQLMVDGGRKAVLISVERLRRLRIPSDENYLQSITSRTALAQHIREGLATGSLQPIDRTHPR